jgi:hypothetical protein
VDLGTGLDGWEKISALSGFDPRTDQLVAGRCTNCAVPTTHVVKLSNNYLTSYNVVKYKKT